MHWLKTRRRQYNSRFDTVISIDVGGLIEYWEPQEPFEKPTQVEWTSKSETGLYEFKKVHFRFLTALRNP